MKSLQKENAALKSHIETLKNDKLVLLEQIKKNEWKIFNLEIEIGDLNLEIESLHKEIEYLENN